MKTLGNARGDVISICFPRRKHGQFDLENAEGDDTEYNFSESESNVETADPEEFDLILPKEDHRKSAANMGAFWGSVLAPTASEKYSRHSRSSTSTQDVDLDAHQSRRLL
jgi:hypothetical protein